MPVARGTERELADAVAAYVATLAPSIAAAEREGRLPPDAIRGLGRLGVLGMTVPEADGGIGASAVAFALVLEELSAVWPSLAVAVSVNSGIVAGSIVRLATAAQRARWLPRLMDGEGLASFCLTEPSSGSDAASLRATAVRDSDGWRISGEKLFVTNARYAPFALVLARVGEADPARPHAGITAFVVPMTSNGIRVGRSEAKHGLLASDTSAIVFDGVRVGRDDLLGEEGRGFGAVALAGLDSGRIGIAAQAVGIARGAIALATAYAKERRQFGRPIAEFQSLRFALARAAVDTDAARLLALRAAWSKDNGLPFGRLAAQAKLFASEAANRATHTALQVLGGYGYLCDFGAERLARDARATTIYEGTSEIQRLVIARSLLAEAA
ncbi:MAG: acyl-CoA dehydrogenase family protein [Chloroflexi bacterium]|nr:acyl-CoA dehydrogenase family protein [Chloroflexota bacterium]